MIEVDDTPLLELPSISTFRRHMIPLSAVAIVQTVSAAFSNQALQIIPLSLFKVCLMCGPIFVALCSILAEGQMYSKGRMLALSLIGVGAFRAVYAEAEGADYSIYHGGNTYCRTLVNVFINSDNIDRCKQPNGSALFHSFCFVSCSRDAVMHEKQKEFA